MHRRPLGRGRVLVVIGSVITLVGCFLPWHSIGGSDGLPVIASGGLGGSGILTFLAAIGSLALVALPYAAGGRPLVVDRTLTFVLLTGLAIVGLLIWPIDLIVEDIIDTGLTLNYLLRYLGGKRPASLRVCT
ncbi:MAG TPA: phosphoribosyltransferase family protein, partial [Candidatus Limnocylindrales bacterium]|nr:phosphoribosyltransferase family protein [Candidatus Limnocylindrales bacterium]